MKNFIKSITITMVAVAAIFATSCTPPNSNVVTPTPVSDEPTGPVDWAKDIEVKIGDYSSDPSYTKVTSKLRYYPVGTKLYCSTLNEYVTILGTFDDSTRFKYYLHENTNRMYFTQKSIDELDVYEFYCNTNNSGDYIRFAFNENQKWHYMQKGIAGVTDKDTPPDYTLYADGTGYIEVQSDSYITYGVTKTYYIEFDRNPVYYIKYF